MRKGFFHGDEVVASFNDLLDLAAMPSTYALGCLLGLRGRPATGTDPQVNVRLEPSLIEQVDAYAKKNDISRSAAIRALLEKALKDE